MQSDDPRLPNWGAQHYLFGTPVLHGQNSTRKRRLIKARQLTAIESKLINSV